MKGEFDQLLDWPFEQQVTFSLLAVDGSKQHREETFTVSHMVFIHSPITRRDLRDSWPAGWRDTEIAR